MGAIRPPSPALLLLAAFSRDEAALDWARRQAVATWGPVALESPTFDFIETDYYEATMGAGLRKNFLAFAEPFDPGRLADVKRQTNDWEEQYAALGGEESISRPLNLDPGYVTLGKVVLASTKDHAHRIYLAEGIYAEVTLSYQHKQWQSGKWTFADYRRADYHRFFSACREYLRRRHRQENAE